MHHLQVAISSCPNDTFAFYHFLNDVNVLPQDVSLTPHYLDIDELNKGLASESWDIVKASFPAGALSDSYELLSSGGAIGFGVGPIVIFKNSDGGEVSGHVPDLFGSHRFGKTDLHVGLPGVHTTANFLWNFFYRHEHSKRRLPDSVIPKFMNFAQIMQSVADREVDLGVVIHEGRFVYKERGFNLYIDLGEYWQAKTASPVPLGGIYIRKSLPDTLKSDLDRALHLSVLTGLEDKRANSLIYREKMMPFMKGLAQELDLPVIEKHIDTYVTGETVALTGQGRKAVEFLYEEIRQKA